MFRLKGTCMNAATVEKEVEVRELRPATQLLFACLHVVFIIVIIIYYYNFFIIMPARGLGLSSLFSLLFVIMPARGFLYYYFLSLYIIMSAHGFLYNSFHTSHACLHVSFGLFIFHISHNWQQLLQLHNSSSSLLSIFQFSFVLV